MIRRDGPVYRFAPRFATQSGVSLTSRTGYGRRKPCAQPGGQTRRIERVTWTSGYTGVMGHPQHVLLFANGAEVAAWAISNQVPATLRATIPPCRPVARPGGAAPGRRHPGPALKFGIISDTRQLGVFLTSVSCRH